MTLDWKIDETRNYPLDQIKHKYLMREKYKKMYGASDYFEHFLVFFSAVSGSILILALALLVGIPIGFASSAIGLKICAITLKSISPLPRKRWRNMI